VNKGVGSLADVNQNTRGEICILKIHLKILIMTLSESELQ